MTPEALTKFVKEQKSVWMHKHAEQPDMNPWVIVERGGRALILVIASVLDKDEGLHIAAVCRRGFAADALTLVCDAHVATAKTKEDGEALMKKWSEPGSMQKACDEEGACKLREITDCMVCTRVDSDGKIQHLVLPYFYDEKYKAEFHWFDDEVQTLNEANPGVVMQGYIPDSLRAIMKLRPYFLGSNASKAAARFLLERNCLIFDMEDKQPITRVRDVDTMSATSLISFTALVADVAYRTPPSSASLDLGQATINGQGI